MLDRTNLVKHYGKKLTDLIMEFYTRMGDIPHFTRVNTLPVTIPRDKQVLFNGTLYRGALSGEFEDYAVGEPVPVKGYWEFSAEFLQADGAAPALRFLYKNDLSAVPTFTRQDVGLYLMELTTLAKNSDLVYAMAGCFCHNGAMNAPVDSVVACARVATTPPTAWLVLHDEDGEPVESTIHTVWDLRIYPLPAV